MADAAQAVADGRRADADTAGVEVREARRGLDDFAAASYRQGSLAGSVTAFLGSEDPADLLARARLLDAVGGAQRGALESMRRARIGKVNRESAARSASEEAQSRRRAAEAAQVAAESAYGAAVAADAAAQQRSEQLLAEKAGLERELDAARRALTGLDGRRQAYDDYQEARPAAVGEATGVEDLAPVIGGPRPGWVVAPTSGRITSTYGARWGTIHYGLDIANRIGTPIVSARDGTVLSAGPASGFGLWVRVRHGDGTITVYGHIDEHLVSVGDRVTAGEQIATVGNRGESTGPHLHFEVIKGGGRKIDPLVWPRANGVGSDGRTL